MAVGALYPVVVPRALEKANDASPTNIQPGATVIDKDGNLYQYLKNATGAADLVAGDFAHYSAPNEVTKNAVGDAAKGFAGIVVSTAITNGQFGWVKIEGTATSAALTPKASIKVGATGLAFADVAVATDVSVGYAISATLAYFHRA